MRIHLHLRQAKANAFAVVIFCLVATALPLVASAEPAILEISGDQSFSRRANEAISTLVPSVVKLTVISASPPAPFTSVTTPRPNLA